MSLALCLTNELLLASAVERVLSLLSAAGRVWQAAEIFKPCVG